MEINMLDCRASSNHLIRIDKGGKIIETLLEFAKEKKLKSAFLTGIGATSRAELGWFDPSEKVYKTRVFDDPCEITTMLGNIAWFGDDPVAHIHVTLSKPDFSVVGGHLIEATIGVTCEIWMVENDLRVERSLNNPWNLKLIDFTAK